VKSIKKHIPGLENASKPHRKAWAEDLEDASFYHTTRWRNLRRVVLTREPMCRDCKSHGRQTPATVCDHIHPVTSGGDKWAEDNLQPLCRRCHNSKSSKERHEKANKLRR